MNVLITGAAGLVGANFVEYLLKHKEKLQISKVYRIDDFSGGYVENLPIKEIDGNIESLNPTHVVIGHQGLGYIAAISLMAR